MALMIGSGAAPGPAISKPALDLPPRGTDHERMTLRAQGWIVVSIAVCLFAFGCTEAKKSVPAGITWNKAIDAALADAQAAHRPLPPSRDPGLCQVCKGVERHTCPGPKFIEYSKRFTMAR